MPAKLTADRPSGPSHSMVMRHVPAGAGTLLYGSEALAGTINIITNEPSFSDDTRWLYGFNGFYSSNENGRRGTATLGVTAPRYAIRMQAGLESFDNYHAGSFDVEDTRPLFASGALRRADTIDDNPTSPA